MPFAIANMTEDLPIISPVNLEDAAEIVQCLTNQSSVDCGDFTLISGFDHLGKPVVCVLGSLTGASAVLRQPVSSIAIAA